MDTPTSPLPANLAKLDENLRRAKAELEAKQAELEQQQAAAKRLQGKLRLLNRDVDQAADQLALADEQCANFKAQLAGLRSTFLGAWGDANAPHGPNYHVMATVEAAVADFPRVREHLVRKLAAAEAALRVFEREHVS